MIIFRDVWGDSKKEDERDKYLEWYSALLTDPTI